MLKNRPVILIGGTGRSGTTILAKIAAAHPDVATLPEWRLLSDPGGILEFLEITESGNPFRVDQAFKRLEDFFSRLESKDYCSRFIAKYLTSLERVFGRRFSHKNHGDYAPDYLPTFSKHRKTLNGRLNDLGFEGVTAATARLQKFEVFATSLKEEELVEAFSEFLCGVADDAMNAGNCKYFLEKNTWSILGFERVSRLYPNSKLVHIYRDPRDVVSSYMSQPWMPTDPRKAAAILLKLYEKWEQQSRLVDSERWTEISLEKLISSPRDTLIELCAFWNIDIADEMFEIGLNDRGTGRWKRDLSASDVVAVEKILGKYIDKYSTGY